MLVSMPVSGARSVTGPSSSYSSLPEGELLSKQMLTLYQTHKWDYTDITPLKMMHYSDYLSILYNSQSPVTCR